jgi:hypothetical protein
MEHVNPLIVSKHSKGHKLKVTDIKSESALGPRIPPYPAATDWDRMPMGACRNRLQKQRVVERKTVTSKNDQ